MTDNSTTHSQNIPANQEQERNQLTAEIVGRAMALDDSKREELLTYARSLLQQEADA